MEKTLLELLEEAYVELTVHETKFTELKNKIGKSLETYYASLGSTCPNPNLKSLLNGEKVTWEFTSQNIKDLKFYTFIQTTAIGSSSVHFKSVGEKVPFRHANYSFENCFGVFQKDRYYLIHNSPKNGQHHWDWAEEIDPSKVQSFTKQLATVFAKWRNRND